MTNATPPATSDAGSTGATGSKQDAGSIDAGRDARSTTAEDAATDDEDEPTDDGVDEVTRVDAGSAASSAFKLSSTDVTPRALLPEEYRCQSAVSPALTWTRGPEGTQSYAVQLRDTEAQNPLRSYWLLYDLPASVTALPRMIPRRATVQSPPARQALDDSRLGTYGYYGPCLRTTLELSVHALDVAELPDVAADAGAAAINAAINEHELSKASILVQSIGLDEAQP